jgi:hypothetical protein
MQASRRDILASLIGTLAMAAVPAWAHEPASHAAAPAAGKGAVRGPNPLATSAAVDTQGRLSSAHLPPTPQKLQPISC